MPDQDRLLSEIQQIIVQYKREISGKHKPWPDAIKKRVMELWKLGLSSRRISERVEIPYQTIYSWEQVKSGQFKPVGLRAKEPEAIGLSPAANKLAVRDTTVRTLTVRTREGFEIEGLTLDQVKFLISGVDV